MTFRSIFVVAAALFVLADTATATEKILFATWRGCEEACEGFRKYMDQSAIDAKIVLRDAAQDEAALPAILAEARATNVDLIVTWGTSVTRGIAGTLRELGDPAFNHDIPQIFMIVADPVGAELIESLDKSGRPNVTGTYNRVPEEVNIETIRSYYPSFDHLGLLYHANEENSVLKRDEIAELAGPMNFQLTALELPLGEHGLPRVEDIAPTVAELKDAGVDFIYIGSSSFLRENGDALTAAAVQSRVPVLSPYEELARESQALLSVAARYEDVGRLAGAQAEKLLSGATPGDLPVARMSKFAVVVNLEVSRKLKLFPPIALLQAAETVN